MRYANPAAALLVLSLAVFLSACGGGGDGGGGNNPSTPTLVSIALTPANGTVPVGDILQLNAVGTFSDNSTQNLTGTTTWSTSNSSVATVGNTTGNKGLVSGLANGTATITATVSGITGSTTITASQGATPANVMSISVNGTNCAASSYINKACVSVTICTPDLATCQVVNDILLDTGSYGLRVFAQAIPNLALPQVASGTGSLTSCVQFADGSSLWGPVKMAAVKLGNEPAVTVPVQVIDASFGTLPLPCANADPTPVSSGFSGILGIGVLTEDCGAGCVVSAGNSIYYRCNGTSCTGTTVPLSDQVQNPVARLPLDNNGLLITLPSVPIGGAPSLEGTMTFGIGTRPNNTPAAPTVFPTDKFGDMMTVFNGVNTNSFLDTGSNGLFFPNADPAVLPTCSAPNSDWYCPPVTRTLLATNVGATGSPSQSVSFNVSNFDTLVQSPNNVFSDIAGPSTFGFDWGIPFFMGRSVFFGFDNRASTLGTGPFVAY